MRILLRIWLPCLAVLAIGAWCYLIVNWTSLATRRRGMSVYNPGLFTAVLLAVIGITYTVLVISGDLLSGINWLWAVSYFVAAIILCLVVPEFGMRSKTTKWRFDAEHCLGYYKRYTTAMTRAKTEHTQKARRTQLVTFG